jgi:hypothetical protein
MLDRGVVRHQVHEQLQAALVRGREESVEVRQRAVDGVDVAEVRDVVAEVGQRARVDRRQPEGVDAQRGDVIQARRNAPQVPYAVAVGVLKRARIDLIDGGHWFSKRGTGKKGSSGVLNEELNLRKESIMIGILIAVLVAALVYAILAALTGSAIVAIVGAILVLLAGIPSGGFGFGSRYGGRA